MHQFIFNFQQDNMSEDEHFKMSDDHSGSSNNGDAMSNAYNARTPTTNTRYSRPVVANEK